MSMYKPLLISSLLNTVFVLIIGFTFPGCAYSINRYKVSADNVDYMKQFQSTSFNVEKFESYKQGLHSIICRASVQVTTPNQVSFESYIEQAFIEELRLAGAYDPKSAIVIRGRLERIDFSSGPFQGNWSMKLTISSKTNPGFTVDSTYEFSASWPFWEACDEVARAFVPAVRKLIGQVVTNPQFRQLAR